MVGRSVRWGVAAVLGLALVSLPMSAGALFAPAKIHKALFHFDESAGVSTVDTVSGTNACLGVAVSNPCPTWPDDSRPTWTSDARYGSALLFDGTNDTVTLEHGPSLNWSSTDNNIVIEAWFKPSDEGTILSKGWSGDHNYRLGIDASGNLTFSYTYRLPNGKLRQAVAASPLGRGQGTSVSFNQWHWVSVSFSHNSDEIRITLDGGVNDVATDVLDKKPGAPDPRTNTLPLSIGSFGGGPPFFKGVVDEVRISIQPDELGLRPIVGSDRGVVISRVEFAPASGNQFIELFRPDLRDGAGPVLLTWIVLREGSGNEYLAPAHGRRCINGDLSCYEVSPGETVRIWLNGAGPALDTASTTFSEWFTSNCDTSASCTLGDGGSGQNLDAVDLVKIRTSGLPKDPDVSWRSLMNADIVVWGGDQSTNGDVFIMVNLEGLWPAVTAFVSSTPTRRGSGSSSQGITWVARRPGRPFLNSDGPEWH